MPYLKLQDNLYDEIMAIITRYWWGGSEQVRKIHWKSWDSLCARETEGMRVHWLSEPQSFQHGPISQTRVAHDDPAEFFDQQRSEI